MRDNLHLPARSSSRFRPRCALAHRTGWIAALLVIATLEPGIARASDGDGPRLSARVRSLIQTRMEVDSATDITRFRLRRARIKLRVRYTKALEANLSVDFGDFALSVLNAYTDVRAIKNHLHVRVGHFKRPFSRQRLSGSADQGVAERTFLKDHFGSGRDLGAMLHNGVKRDGFRWSAGVFGDFDLATFIEVGQDEIEPVFAARVEYAMDDLDGYSETDSARTGIRAGGAASVLYMMGDKRGQEGVRWEVDAIAKLYGATLSVAWFGRQGETTSVSAPKTYINYGVYTHAAYRFIQELEVAARWSGLFPDGSSARHEVTGALNAYLFDEHLRATVDGSLLRAPVAGTGATAPVNEWRVRVQLQFR